MPHTKNFYSVAKGRALGIYKEWSLCEESINKFPNAVFKGFTDINEAVHFLIANETYTFCCEIPVFIDSNVSGKIRDYEHECNHTVNTNIHSESNSPEPAINHENSELSSTVDPFETEETILKTVQFSESDNTSSPNLSITELFHNPLKLIALKIQVVTIF